MCERHGQAPGKFNGKRNKQKNIKQTRSKFMDGLLRICADVGKTNQKQINATSYRQLPPNCMCTVHASKHVRALADDKSETPASNEDTMAVPSFSLSLSPSRKKIILHVLHSVANTMIALQGQPVRAAPCDCFAGSTRPCCTL